MAGLGTNPALLIPSPEVFTWTMPQFTRATFFWTKTCIHAYSPFERAGMGLFPELCNRTTLVLSPQPISNLWPHSDFWVRLFG